MPTYEYVCANEHAFERIQKMSDEPVASCPECGASASRKISGGQGLIFKGSGFYITDYGKDGKGPRKGSGGVPAAADASPATKSDAKPQDQSSQKSDKPPVSPPTADPATTKSDKRSSSSSKDAG
jgi:putative FmdB family regulatory protein